MIQSVKGASSHAEEGLKKAWQTGWNVAHDWHPIWEQTGEIINSQQH